MGQDDDFTAVIIDYRHRIGTHLGSIKIAEHSEHGVWIRAPKGAKVTFYDPDRVLGLGQMVSSDGGVVI